MKKRVVVRKSKNALTPLNKKLLMALVVIVLVGVVIAILNPGLTGDVIGGGRPIKCPLGHPNADEAAILPIDYDKDGVNDLCDNCPGVYNPAYFFGRNKGKQLGTDADRDGVPNTCDKYPRSNDKASGNDDDGDGNPDSEDPRPNVAGDYSKPKTSSKSKK